jgi:hypothetical protein
LLYDLQGLGIDLREVFRGNPRVTPRYVLMLVGQLSDDSALAASVRGGPEFRSWTLQNYLLAAIVNIVNAANMQRAGKKAKPVVKPPQKAVKRKVLTVAEILARQKNDAS